MKDTQKYCRSCQQHYPRDMFGSKSALCRQCESRAAGERKVAARGGVKTCRSCQEVKPDGAFMTRHRCKDCVGSKVCSQCSERKALDQFIGLGRVCSVCYPSYKNNLYRVRFSDPEQRSAILAKNRAAKITAGARYKSQQRDYRNRKRAEMKSAVLNAYGGKCICCGEAELLFLTLDHVNDDGAFYRKALGQYDTWKHAYQMGFPDSYRVLCYNCNAGRYRNGGRCPHESGRSVEESDSSLRDGSAR